MIAVSSAWVWLAADKSAGEEPAGARRIAVLEAADPEFHELIPRDAEVEVLAEGFEWSEGPVWWPHGERLLFSDVPRNTVFQWQEGKGIDVFLKPSGYTSLRTRGGESGSNGLAVDAEGRLVLCQHGDRRVAVWSEGCFRTLADRYQGKPLNSPNDLVIRSNGDIYFTDPPYGMTPEAAQAEDALGFCGVYRISRDGELTLLTDRMTRPNGIGFSPDEKTLYVGQSDPAHPIWMAFPVRDDGTLGEGKIFFDASVWKESKLPGSPDGLKVDSAGNVFATGPGGVNVFRSDGRFLGRIRLSVPASNCAFGNDGSVLYITADMYLLRVRTKTKGLGF
ncbi:MAG: SMP-30/gluconolactonase/LRE family protein [Thermogutta sp.]|nr:SMP-30/gluconolactonase/LRE family protein [Thermogutta sp.]